MTMFSTQIVVRRYSRRKEFGGVQRLEREFRLFGWCFWRTVIDTEEVPAWAEIELGAFGFTSWRSKFAEHINRRNSEISRGQA